MDAVGNIEQSRGAEAAAVTVLREISVPACPSLAVGADGAMPTGDPRNAARRPDPLVFYRNAGPHELVSEEVRSGPAASRD